MAVQYCNYDIKGTLAVTGTSTFTGAATFVSSINMSDNQPINFGGQTMFTHTGSVTSIGDNSSSSVLNISSGDATFTGNVILGTGDNLYLNGTTGLRLLHDGSNALFINQTAGDIKIQNSVSDKDIIFIGKDGASAITSLRLDMSDSGWAYFNSGVQIEAGLYIPSYIYHNGDTGTYFGFEGDDSWRVVTNSSERISVNNSGLRIGSGARVTTTLDEDNMASNSATALATQQSIKAYVDTSVSGAGTVTSVATTNGITGGTITSTGTIQVDSTVVRTTGAQTIAGEKTFTNQLAIDTAGGSERMRLYNENNTAPIADSFSGNTSKSYIYFDTVSGSNDPGYIMHESSATEGNEGVLHLVPTDDNSTGDYVSIHGTNDPDVLKLHTSGLIETENLQLQLKSGLSVIYLNDGVTIQDDLTVSGGDITLGGTGRIQGVDTVSASTDAANKAYVDAHVSPAGTYLPLVGGTMSGNIVMGDNDITGIDQLIFSSGTYLTDTSSNYVQLRYASTTAGGMLVTDGDGTTQGYLYADGGATSNFGLLHGSGSWAVRCKELAEVELRYNNTARLQTINDGVYVAGKLGIGTSDPDAYGYAFAEDLVIYGGASASDGAGITIAGNGKRYGIIAFGDTADSNAGEIFYDHNVNAMHFRTNSSSNVVFINSAGKVTAGAATGSSDGSSTLTTKGYVDALIATIPSGLNFQGNWNASTNSPTLASGTGTPGFYYNVSVAGTTDLDGETDWQVGDWAVFVENGANDFWEKIDNTSALTGVGVSGRVTFWSSTNTLSSDADLTFDGSNLTVGGNLAVGGSVTWSGGGSAESNSAYDNMITAFSDSGSSTITLTLTQQDGGTLTTSFSNPQGTVTGTGLAGRVAYWSSNTNITNDADFTFDGADLSLGTQAGTTAARLVLYGTTANNGPSTIKTTDGNLHIDADDNHSIYLGYYTGANVIVGTGNGGVSGTQFNASGDVIIGDELTIVTIANATSDTDKFLVSDSGVVKYRTGAQVLSDIGAASSGSLSNYLPLAGGRMITTAKIEFYNASQYIHANSTNDLTIASGDDINFQTNYARFFNASVEHARLSSTTDSWIGNGTNSQVGINKANPTYNLDVEGTFRTTGAATIEGNGTFNGSQVTFNPDADSSLRILNAGTDAIAIFAGTGDTLYLGGNNTTGMYLDTSANATFAGQITTTQDQITTNIATTSAIRLKPADTTNTTGKSSIFLGTSPVDNYGISLRGARLGTDGTPTFELATHNNSNNGTVALSIDSSQNATFGSNLTVGGNLTVVDIVTASKGRFTSTSDASVGSTLHAFQTGLTSGLNIIMDNNEIMARNNGAVATLNVNPDGGAISFHSNGTSSILTDAGNATFGGDLTVNGGDITLAGTGRIQGVDTVSAGTDAANKDYVDTAVAGSGSGTVTGVSSSTTSQLTVSESSPAPALSIVTAAVTNGGTALATGDQIYDATTARLTSYLPLAGGTMTGSIRLNDNVQLQIGSSNDAYITHNGTNTYFVNGVGNLEITNDTNDGDIIFKCDDGSGGVVEYLRIDGQYEQVYLRKDMQVADGQKIMFGDSVQQSGDLEIYHDGSNSYINDTGTGNLIITGSQLTFSNVGDTEYMAKMVQDGTVELYYNGSKKFETTVNGIALPQGNNASPSISRDGDNNTGMYWGASDELNFSTAGINRLIIDSNGLTVNGNVSLDEDVILGASSSIVLDDTPTASTASGSGTIVNWSVSTSVTAGTLYVVKTDGGWTTADADSEAKSTAMAAIALGSNATAGMLLQGFFYKASHGFAIGSPLYISNTAGAFTNSRPTGTGDYVRIIGYATSTNYIYFDPDKTWVKID